MEAGTEPRAPFRWTLKREGIIAPDERLPWPQTIAVGLQHIFAMFGATVLAPILMGFDPNTAILFSGIGTLIFFVVVGGRVPSYLGSSFAFIAVVIAATGYDAAAGGPNPNLAVALGGIIAAGALYAAIGLVVMAIGTAWIETLMPPVVTGAVVAVIGLNLAPVAVAGIEGTIWTVDRRPAHGAVRRPRRGLCARHGPPPADPPRRGHRLPPVLRHGQRDGPRGPDADLLRRRRERGLDRDAQPHRARRST